MLESVDLKFGSIDPKLSIIEGDRKEKGDSMCNQVTVLWAARYDYEKGRSLHPHEHGFYQIIWVAEGKGWFQCNDELLELAPGTLYFIHPGTVHGLQAHRNTMVKTLDLKFDIHSSELREQVTRVSTRMPHAEQEIVRLLDRIRQEGAEHRPYFKELANLYLTELIYRLARASAPSEPIEIPPNQSSVMPSSITSMSQEETHAAARMVAKWVEAHASTSWSLRELSQQIGYSVNHLCQVFKRFKGCTILDYQKQVRIHNCKQWLTYGDYTLKEVSELAGFKTVQHFGRVFRQIEGVTPGQWMAKEKQGIRKDILFVE